MLRLSICMMVKDESVNLRRCLESLHNLRKNISNELIIIDTGSSDDTVKIAYEYTEQVYFHEWNNNFSEMRNKSISYAKGDWIFIIDADEELVIDKGLIAFLKDNEKRYSAAMLNLLNITDLSGKISSSLKTIRIFKRDEGIRYEGSVHNRLIVSGEVLDIEGSLNHYGYFIDDSALMEKKFERTSKLLLSELEKDPLNIYYRFQLGTSYDMHNDLELAKLTYERAYNDLKYNNFDRLEHHYLMAAYVKVLINTKDYLKAVEIGLEGLEVEPDNIDLLYFIAVANLFLKELDQAIYFFDIYLEKLKIIHTLPISINPSFQLYTLNIHEECSYNLLQLYLLKENWEKVICYSRDVLNESNENSAFFNVALNAYIKACVQEKEGNLIINLFEEYNTSRWDSLDRIIYATSSSFSIEDISNRLFFECLETMPSKLGKLYRFRLMKSNLIELKANDQIINDFSVLIQQECDEALYLMIEAKIDLSEVLLNCDELMLMKMFSVLNDKYSGFENLVISYLKKFNNLEEYAELNLKRILSKYLALISFGKENATSEFGKYLEIGMELLTRKYQKKYLLATNLQDFKSSEEQFLFCVWIIINEKSIDRSSFFKQAVSCLPEWEASLYLWLEKEFSSNNDGRNDEFEELLGDLKKQVTYLIDNKNNKGALDIINDYLLIKPDDVEMLNLKSELMEKISVH